MKIILKNEAKTVSKVPVVESHAYCYDIIDTFCNTINLIGFKVQNDNIMSVLKSNVALGAIFLSKNDMNSVHGGITLAREIHQAGPELPIFLRWEVANAFDDPSEQDRKLFSSAYAINATANLHRAIDEFIFSVIYPNDLLEANLAQVFPPINHLHRYISFGSGNPHLSFK